MIFLNSASSAAALGFYLPRRCTNTDTEGKQRRNRVRNIFEFQEKTQYLMNTLYLIEQSVKFIYPRKIIVFEYFLFFSILSHYFAWYPTQKECESQQWTRELHRNMKTKQRNIVFTMLLNICTLYCTIYAWCTICTYDMVL